MVWSCYPLAQPPKSEDYLLSAARDCLFNTFATTLHTLRPSPPSANRGHYMQCWQGPTSPALVNTVMNLRVPQKAVNYLTSWLTIKFSIRNLLHGVSYVVKYEYMVSQRKTNCILENCNYWHFKSRSFVWPNVTLGVHRFKYLQKYKTKHFYVSEHVRMNVKVIKSHCNNLM
jgi:hypothetical protein